MVAARLAIDFDASSTFMLPKSVTNYAQPSSRIEMNGKKKTNMMYLINCKKDLLFR